VGPYEVLSLIGSGGMGEVYKARDTRLGRTVAIKILHTPDADLRQRFDREARLVASLQHPHICSLIDVGEHAGADYIVMEYLDGRTLTCPQPPAKVIEYGMQIADAVDAVHRKGQIHRDLKPANIIVTAHGVKVLDFGIAKATGQQETVTLTGVAVGTPGYMAPEQWRGAADHRTDIFALGCVLYEMATGQKPGDKPLEPARLDWVVRGCLATDPDERWQSARDVSRLLASVGEPASLPAAVGPRRRAWLWPAVSIAALLLSLLAVWRFRPAPPRETFQLSIAPPPDTEFLVARNAEGGLAVSPDGQRLLFVAVAGGRPLLFMRRFDSAEAQPLAGTEGASFPFWSPDSTWIAFHTPDRLMKIPAIGGAPQVLAKIDPRVAGGSWGAGNVLLDADLATIYQVPASGGAPARLMPGSWPYFLPDGKHFLFQRENATWVGSIDTSEQPRQLIEAPARKPVYSAGHVLFARNRTLMARAFDPASLQLSGSEFAVAQSLATGDPSVNPADFSAGPDGLLVFAAGGRPNKLVWRDRSGKVLDELATGDDLGTPRISPDGRRVAFARIDRENMDIYVGDLVQPSQLRRLTFDPAMDRYPVWSPDGATITFSSGEVRSFDLFRKASDGTGGIERLTSEPSAQHAMDWSADGKHLSFTRNIRGTDLMILPAGGQPYMFFQTNVSEAHSQFSPTMPRRLAYSSDEIGGRREIYVTDFVPGKPAGDVRWQISTAGGTMPRWRRDGSELYYWALDGTFMAAKVDNSGSAFRWSTPAPLFRVQPPTLRTNDISFDVTRDGERFLILEPVERARSQPLSILTNWLAAAKK
jgi:Tol biopolymer transport system component/predicted Ser/Thr protein kinase